jgi:hypothetical protein
LNFKYPGPPVSPSLVPHRTCAMRASLHYLLSLLTLEHRLPWAPCVARWVPPPPLSYAPRRAPPPPFPLCSGMRSRRVRLHFTPFSPSHAPSSSLQSTHKAAPSRHWPFVWVPATGGAPTSPIFTKAEPPRPLSSESYPQALFLLIKVTLHLPRVSRVLQDPPGAI